MSDNKAEIAVCTIEYLQEPNGKGESFIEIRRWNAAGREELVLEQGRVDEKGELDTHCEVMPYYFTTEQALASLGD